MPINLVKLVKYSNLNILLKKLSDYAKRHRTLFWKHCNIFLVHNSESSCVYEINIFNEFRIYSSTIRGNLCCNHF